MSECDLCELFLRRYDHKIDAYFGECQHPRKAEYPEEFCFPCQHHRNKTRQLILG